MKTPSSRLTPTTDHPLTMDAFGHHARALALHHGERILAEIPTTLRRVATLCLVLSISIPVMFVALVVVLWHAAS